MAHPSQPTQTVQTRPEPMNVIHHHSKLKVSITLPKYQIYVAGQHISGRMEMESRAEGALGIGRVRIELFATQELSSRDHSAQSLFLHAARLFQGPGLPPSNAVHAYPQPGDAPLPANYYPARRGLSTFLFRFPIPRTAPGSINFGGGVAKVQYELRASVDVIGKDEKEKRELVCTREVAVVESWDPPAALLSLLAARAGGAVDPMVDMQLQMQTSREGVVVGENGKIWARASVVGGFVVAGEPACVELMVKNHSTKKNTGLTVTLSRILILPNVEHPLHHPPKQRTHIHISDTLLTVPFRGSEYIINPGGEGVASLVFDVPENARGVRGGTIIISGDGDGDGEDADAADAAGEPGALVHRGRKGRDWREEERKESLFEVRCVLGVRIDMGIGTKDIQAELTVPVFHPVVVPDDMDFDPQPPATVEPYPYAMDQYAAKAGTPPASYPLQQVPQAPYGPVPAAQIHQPQPHPPITVYNNLPPSFAQYPVQSASPVAYLDEASNRLWFSPPPMGAGASNVPAQGQHLINNGMFAIPHRSLSASPGAIALSPVLGTFQNLDQPVSIPLSPGYGYPEFGPSHGVHVQDIDARAGTGLDQAAEEGKGHRAARVAHHLKMSSRHRSLSPIPHRFPMGVGASVVFDVAPQTAAGSSAGGGEVFPAWPSSGAAGSNTQGVHGTKRGRTLPPLPMPLLPTLPASGSLEPGVVVHSPRPLLSPKTSYVDLHNNNGRSPKSDSVKTLEQLAEEVGRSNGDLSGDEGLAAVAGASPKEEEERGVGVDVNKTLPKPPSPTESLLLLTAPALTRTNRDETAFPMTNNNNNLPDSGPPTKAPPTPRAAITPVKLNNLFTPKVSATFPVLPAAESGLAKSLTSQRSLLGAGLPSQLPGHGPRSGAQVDAGGGESGLDALERKLLAEVGTRKPEGKKPRDVRDVLAGLGGMSGMSPPSGLGGPAVPVLSALGGSPNCNSRPVEIPKTRAIGAYNEPTVNDSCISSLTLAGEREREEWAREVGERELEGERERDGEREARLEMEARKRLESLGVLGDNGYECEADVDSDDRTHKAKRSSGSGESRRTKRGSDWKRKHKAKSTKSRKSDGEGEGSSSEGRRRGVKKRDKEKGRAGECQTSRTKKKAEASKGRVAAWLGTIEPETPPEEQEVAISPVAEFRPTAIPDFEDPATAEWAKEDDTPNDDVPIATQQEDVSSLPNPRSSGFVPIGTLKNEWNTFQLRRARFNGGTTAKRPVHDIGRETMRIRDIWSSAGISKPAPASSPQQVEPRPVFKTGVSPTRPVISPPAPAMQSIRTDRRVSPPSSAAVVDMNILTAKHFSKPSIPSPISPPRDPKPSDPSAKASPAAGVAAPKISPRISAFPPPSKAVRDPEVKYDVQSARGGRGGQVTAIASVWASATGKSTLAELKAGNLTPFKKPGNRLPPPRDQPKLAPITAVPTSVDESDPTTIAAPGRTKGVQRKLSGEGVSAPQRMPAPIKLSVGGITLGKPAAPKLTTNSEGVTKGTSVPAVVSSSHATPTLSSTASLVRPMQKVRSSYPLVQPNLKVLPVISEQKATDQDRTREPRHSVAVASPAVKPAAGNDMGFGKARLRDLIKKYQGQAA